MTRRLLLPIIALLMFAFGFSIAAVVVAGRDEVARSDRFWSVGAVHGMAAEDFESLEELAQSADLVVVGTVRSVSAGREWLAVPSLVDDPVYGDYAYARFATVGISIETIVGAARAPLPDRTSVNLEVFLPTPDTLAILEKSIPGERAIFFLRNKGPKDSIDFYRLTNDEQGLLREFDGRLRIAPAGETHFLTHLDGASFDEVLARVAAARGSS